MKIIGLEMIAVQVNSPLYKDLTAMFQSVIDVRTKSHRDLVKTIDYANKVLPVEFPKIVKKHTGMEVFECTLSKGWDFGFWCQMYVKNWYQASTILDTISGVKAVQYKPVTAKALEEIAAKVNTKDSTFHYTNKASAKADDLVGCLINFDPYTGFFLEEIIPGKEFTAEELAAIMLHELGHMYSVLEHAADKYARLTMYTQAVDYFNHNAPLKEQIAYAKVAAANAGTDEKAEKLRKAINTLDSNITEAEEAKNKPKMLSEIVVAILLWFFLYILFGFIARTINQIQDELAGVGAKHGDIRATRQTLTYAEQYADEFAVRHGAGAALATSLDKIHKFSMGSDYEPSVGGHVLHALGLFLCSLYGNPGDTTYETDKDRINSILRETAGLLKRADKLPKAIRDKYIADYDAIKKVVNSKSPGQKVSNAAESFWSAINYLANPVSLWTWIVDARFVREYRILSQNVGNLKTTALFYHAAKLNQLGE